MFKEFYLRFKYLYLETFGEITELDLPLELKEKFKYMNPEEINEWILNTIVQGLNENSKK